MGQYDITLRHIAHRHPEDLARALLPAGVQLDVVGWYDTQLTLVERRTDKALDLRVAGERRLLHVEIATGMDAEDADRFHDYSGLLLLALRREAPKAPREPGRLAPEGGQDVARPKPRAKVPVLTMVILLAGRKAPWPEQVPYVTGWPEAPFSGTHFRVEAVYQRTVTELRARGGLLWLVFTPLARDATAAALREVVAELGARVPDAGERRELYTALFLMAGLDPWGHNLEQEIGAMLDEDDREEIMQNKWLRALWEEGERKGEQKILSGVFARQAGHAPSPDEQQALARRARELGAEEAVMALVKLHGDALVAWLLGDGRSLEHAG